MVYVGDMARLGRLSEAWRAGVSVVGCVVGGVVGCKVVYVCPERCSDAAMQ